MACDARTTSHYCVSYTNFPVFPLPSPLVKLFASTCVVEVLSQGTLDARYSSPSTVPSSR